MNDYCLLSTEKIGQHLCESNIQKGNAIAEFFDNNFEPNAPEKECQLYEVM